MLMSGLNQHSVFTLNNLAARETFFVSFQRELTLDGLSLQAIYLDTPIQKWMYYCEENHHMQTY